MTLHLNLSLDNQFLDFTPTQYRLRLQTPRRP
jgi:hypothetical protein